MLFVDYKFRKVLVVTASRSLLCLVSPKYGPISLIKKKHQVFKEKFQGFPCCSMNCNCSNSCWRELTILIITSLASLPPPAFALYFYHILGKINMIQSWSEIRNKKVFCNYIEYHDDHTIFIVILFDQTKVKYLYSTTTTKNMHKCQVNETTSMNHFWCTILNIFNVSYVKIMFRNILLFYSFYSTATNIYYSMRFIL